MLPDRRSACEEMVERFVQLTADIDAINADFSDDQLAADPRLARAVPTTPSSATPNASASGLAHPSIRRRPSTGCGAGPRAYSDGTSHSDGSGRGALEDLEGLQVAVEVEGVVAALAADAGDADAAERRREVADEERVDPHDAAAHGPPDPLGPLLRRV